MTVYLSEAQNHMSDRQLNKRIVPATSPIPGTNMAANNGGGFSFVIDDFGILRRFLMIGSETPGYNVTTQTQTKQGFDAIKRCLELDGQAAVQMIVDISTSGRAPKNDPAIVALAVAASNQNSAELAFSVLPKVCRTGTHLFQFVSLYDVMGKWNAVAKRGIAAWYNGRSADRLAVQMLKYQQRNGWSHRDVLRLSHVKPIDDTHSAMYRYATRSESSNALPELYHTVAKMNAGDLCPSQIISLIEQNDSISWEMVPTQYLSYSSVLAALVPNMGITALIRKLGQLSSKGVTDSPALRTLIAGRLTDETLLQKGRIHPLTLLQAFKQYSIGHGERGSLSWEPDAKIKAALDDAFYLAFAATDDTDENYLVGIDISGSMGGAKVNGSPNMTAAEVAVVMGMAAVRSQSNSQLFGFNNKLVDLKITPTMTLQSAQNRYRSMNWDGASTNAGLLFEYALQHKMDIDKFVVVTDNDINTGSQPAQLLKKYRRRNNGKGKLAVIATSMSKFSIADPNDSGMIDIAGFDAAAPQIIANL